MHNTGPRRGHLFKQPPHDRVYVRKWTPFGLSVSIVHRHEEQTPGPSPSARLKEARAHGSGQGARERLARAQARLEGRHSREERQHVADQEEARQARAREPAHLATAAAAGPLSSAPTRSGRAAWAVQLSCGAWQSR